MDLIYLQVIVQPLRLFIIHNAIVTLKLESKMPVAFLILIIVKNAVDLFKHVSQFGCMRLSAI